MIHVIPMSLSDWPEAYDSLHILVNEVQVHSSFPARQSDRGNICVRMWSSNPKWHRFLATGFSSQFIMSLELESSHRLIWFVFVWHPLPLLNSLILDHRDTRNIRRNSMIHKKHKDGFWPYRIELLIWWPKIEKFRASWRYRPAVVASHQLRNTSLFSRFELNCWRASECFTTENVD